MCFNDDDLWGLYVQITECLHFDLQISLFQKTKEIKLFSPKGNDHNFDFYVPHKIWDWPLTLATFKMTTFQTLDSFRLVNVHEPIEPFFYIM